MCVCVCVRVRACVLACVRVCVRAYIFVGGGDISLFCQELKSGWWGGGRGRGTLRLPRAVR